MVKIDLLLSALTACTALVGYLSLLPYLGPLPRFFFPAALALGFYLQRTGRALPARVLTPLSIALFLYFASGFTPDRLVQVAGDLLMVFLGIRLLGERVGRNYLQAFALSLFCLAASSLNELSAVFLVYLLLLLLLLAVSLVLLTFHAHDPAIVLPEGEARKVLSVSVMIPVASLPILLFLFIILPRTQYPLWNFLNAPTGSQIGFSDTVKPGSASSLAEVKGVVLRATSAKVPLEKLYWRGIVLNGFRDDAWVRLPVPEERAPVVRGRVVIQEIYPERSRQPYLPALNVTRSISGVRHEASTDSVFSAGRPLDKKVRYLAESALADNVEVRGGIDREFYLRLPGAVSERLRAKGRELARPELDDEQRLRLLERFYRDQRISYSNTDLPVGSDPLDSFLFDRRRGNCEYFASSYATLLRLAGIPSRLVGGYRGGNYNEMGGYYLVTEDMAHVWVEAYLEGAGWRFIDPSAWAVGAVRSGGAAKGFSMYLDAAGFYWDKAVVAYDLEKQIALVKQAGSKARDFHLPKGTGRGLATLLLALLPVAALAGWYLKRPKSTEGRLLKQMLKSVRKRYPGAITGAEGLFDLAAKLDDPRLRQFVKLYGDAVYRDRPLQKDEVARLKEIIRDLGQHRS